MTFFDKIMPLRTATRRKQNGHQSRRALAEHLLYAPFPIRQEHFLYALSFKRIQAYPIVPYIAHKMLTFSKKGRAALTCIHWGNSHPYGNLFLHKFKFISLEKTNASACRYCFIVKRNATPAPQPTSMLRQAPRRARAQWHAKQKLPRSIKTSRKTRQRKERAAR